MNMRTGRAEITKIPKILGFTIIESIFVIIAVVVLAFILAGLYFKHNKLPIPDSQERTSEGPTSGAGS